eukprot:gnl/TRDRNA2_/TRDRNA2_80447_c0_seq1.p1 gnl/TRDRNA2_/TRDRNA2_80447_c0~~gnl/TRDRNA2_/TRDRNA2_80447_c0_seq1.p1  ORF type:complete len:215 (-),score=43.94 gnl/TRDRNA2_/TRDRNA2_80447_c0_seq1:16-660(-)
MSQKSGDGPPVHDYDDEARKLWKRLNLPDKGDSRGSAYNDADAVWAHPKTQAKFFIGNISIAENKSALLAKGIRNVVNCQEQGSENFHEADPSFSYMRFPITLWQRAPGTQTEAGLLEYMAPLFTWIDGKLEKGENVMVHCLAGAHRAGTAGTAYVMYKTGLDAKSAVKAVKAIRPFVDPIYDFAELLRRLEGGLKSVKQLCQEDARGGSQTGA